MFFIKNCWITRDALRCLPIPVGVSQSRMCIIFNNCFETMFPTDLYVCVHLGYGDMIFLWRVMCLRPRKEREGIRFFVRLESFDMMKYRVLLFPGKLLHCKHTACRSILIFSFIEKRERERDVHGLALYYTFKWQNAVNIKCRERTFPHAKTTEIRNAYDLPNYFSLAVSIWNQQYHEAHHEIPAESIVC